MPPSFPAWPPELDAGTDDIHAEEALRWYHTKLFVYVLLIVFAPAASILGWYAILLGIASRPVLGNPRPHPRVRYHLACAKCCTACAAVAVRRAEALCLGVRLRVSFLPFACGWILATGGCGPTAMRIGHASLPTEAGPASSYLFLVPIGIFLIVLSLRPMDGVVLRVACVLTMGLLLLCTLLLYTLAHGLVMRDARLTWLAGLCWMAMVACVALGTALVPAVRRLTVNTTSGAAIPQMPSRRVSHRLWVVLRIAGVFAGSALGLVPYVSYTAASTVWKLGPAGRFELSHVAGFGATGFFFLVLAILATPIRRGRLLRYLAAWPDASEDRAAACIAELMAPLRDKLHVSPRRFVQAVQSKFRAIRIGDLTLEALLAPGHSLSTYNCTVPAQAGKVDAWISHSRLDDPRLRWEGLHLFGQQFREEHGREALVYMDLACLPPRPHDRAASQRMSNMRRAPVAPDVSNAMGASSSTQLTQLAALDMREREQDAPALAPENLAMMPLHIQGCAMMVILAGPMYPRSLQGALEIFAFITMGGSRSNIRLLQLGSEPLGPERLFRHWNGQNTRGEAPTCRERLLGIIEAVFGDLAPFNTFVCRVFDGKRAVRATHRIEYQDVLAAESHQRRSRCDGGVARARSLPGVSVTNIPGPSPADTRLPLSRMSLAEKLPNTPRALYCSARRLWSLNSDESNLPTERIERDSQGSSREHPGYRREPLSGCDGIGSIGAAPLRLVQVVPSAPDSPDASEPGPGHQTSIEERRELGLAPKPRIANGYLGHAQRDAVRGSDMELPRPRSAKVADALVEGGVTACHHDDAGTMAPRALPPLRDASVPPASSSGRLPVLHSSPPASRPTALRAASPDPSPNSSPRGRRPIAHV